MNAMTHDTGSVSWLRAVILRGLGGFIWAIGRAIFWLSRLLALCLTVAVRAYQFALRPLLPGSCRFVPTCSEYALEALRRHGPWRGTLIAAKRIMRCHPWGGQGFDPAP